MFQNKWNDLYMNGKEIENIRLWKTVLELPDNKTEHLPGYLSLVPCMPVLQKTLLLRSASLMVHVEYFDN